MAEIRWTDEAQFWLQDIHNYIAQDNLDAANRLVEGIYNKVQILYDFPETGYKYERIKNRNIRILLYGHFRIAYLIKDSAVEEATKSMRSITVSPKKNSASSLRPGSGQASTTTLNTGWGRLCLV